MPCVAAAHRRATRFLCILVVVGFSVAYGTLDDADASELIYSPWEKFCVGADTCFIGSDARSKSECKPVVIAAVVLVERTTETKKTLRIILPNVRVEDGARISIDGEQPIPRPFERCYPNGCMANREAGAELVDQLKHGRTLLIEAMSSTGAPIAYSLPLAGFATAYDGPAIAPPVFVEVQGKLQEELLRRAIRRLRNFVKWSSLEPQISVPSTRANEDLPERPPENRKAGCNADGG
jgi:invasion protein IalB